VPRLKVADWRCARRAFGQIRCTPPEGEEFGEIMIHERARPLVSLRALVDQRFPVGAAIEQAIQLTTLEGEFGAVISFDTAAEHRALGVICGDDFQTIVDGRTTLAEHRERICEVTREIVLNLPLGLGEVRHRRFWFRPPDGWQGLVRGLVTDWFPLDYPQTPTTIKVLPARPLDAMFPLDTLFRDDTFRNVALDDEVSRTPLALGAFKGTIARASSSGRAFLTAALEDLRYVYVLRLMTTIDRLPADEAVFMDVVRSCVPLPTVNRRSETVTQVFDHWVT
jgi:hypothetical protein